MRIALCAKMRRGKTTVANYLVEKHGFVRIGFADKLKEMVADLRPDLFENNNKPRLELQNFGQMAKEVLGRDVWVNVALRRINFEATGGARIVLDDLRFDFEAEALRKAGFVIVKIEGINRETGANHAQSMHEMHESELGVDSIKPDYTIYNSGNLDALYKVVERLLHEVNSK